MKVNRVYIGNKEEAFISPIFNDGINLIYSNDNNKGKTILIQSIGYSLGNKPLFPNSFNYSNYYFIIDIEHNHKKFSICRRKNNYFVLNNNECIMLQGESDLKKWFNQNILIMPKIIKNQRVMIADFELLLQTFYLGQDIRNTSSVNSTYFNKDDFTSMLCHMAGCSSVELTDEYLEIKRKVEELIKKQKEIKSKTKLIKKLTKESTAVSEYADKEVFKIKMNEIQELVKIQTDLKCQRNRLYVRISKNTKMINEINSIKISIPEGKLICSICGSTDIVYSVNKDVSFDISNDEMKKQIIKNLLMLNENLKMEIEEIELELSKITKKLQNILSDKDVDPINIVLYNKEINADINYEKDLLDVQKNIETSKKILDEYTSKIDKNNEKEKEIVKKIINNVTMYYRLFDKDDEIQIKDIFSKSSEIYSGSENTVFFISRLLAFENVLKHEFPIIIDGFREGELSTPTEKKVIDTFKKINKQIILTATLKNEEYHKYDDDILINKYDFSSIESKHLLQRKYIDEFEKKIKEFSLSLN